MRCEKNFCLTCPNELKTPLALIQGYAEGLQECINDDAESREFYVKLSLTKRIK